MFVNVFTGIGMKLDNYQNATLGNWSMLGYFIGGIATIWLSVKGVHFKYLFAAGFLFWDYPPCSCTLRYRAQACTNE